MKFLRPKKDEKTKHFFMQDIVRRTIENHPILKENLPIVEIHFDRMKELFREHRRAIFGVLILVISLSILSAFSMGHASVTNFYPTSCLGGWEHPENAQGEPDLPEGSKIEDYTISNSARLDKSSGSIFCGSFKGEVLDNTQPTNFHLSFSWSVDDGSVNHNEVKPFENVSNTDQQNINTTDTNSNSIDVNNSSTTDTNNNSNVDLIEVPNNSDTPSVIETPATPSESESAPAQNDNPVQAFLYKIFSTPAFAQESTNSPAVLDDTSNTTTDTSVTDINISTTDSNPPVDVPLVDGIPATDISTSDAFAEVDYTLDGTDWKTLGTISRSQWKNASFDIPLDAWANLNNLQVSIKTLPTYDTPAVIYLDAMKMSIEYQDIKEILNRPTVEFKDSSSVISNTQQDFNSNEDVNFIINTPNLDINNIKDLVNNGTAEVVDDKAGLLSDTPVVDTTTSDNTINSVKDIFKPTSESLNKALPDDLQDSNVIVLPNIPKQIENKPVSFLDFFKTKKALADTSDVTAKVLDLNGDDTDINTRVVNVNINGINKQQVQIIKGREFKPGKYTLKVTVNTPQAVIISQQDFTWGVLSINTNKSIFEVGDDAYLQMGVLNDGGHTICNADLDLSITSPSGNVNNFSTNDNSIIRDPQCGPDNVISVPDYYAHFNIPSENGTYKMRLTATTLNGTKSINDTFDVVQNSNFVVERVGPSRIYPYDTPYPMNIKITAKNNWQGTISEYVPESFDISQNSNSVQYASVNVVEDPSDPTLQVKKISWNVSLIANQETNIGYIFNAPPVSPEFYTLGKIQLNNNGNISFEESRNWQIASDSACTMTTGTWNGTANTNNVGNVTGTAVWTGCSGGAGFSPAVGDTVTIGSGITLTITGSGSIAGITMGTPTVANALIINDGFTLTDSGALTFNSNSSAVNSLVTLGSSSGAGNLTVGSISMASPGGAVASIEKINCSTGGTGTLTVSGTGTIAIAGSGVASNTGSASIDMTAGACNVITGTGTNTLTGSTTGASPAAFIRMGTGTITFNSSLAFAGATAGKTALITANGTTISLNNASLPSVGASGSYTITSATNLVSAGTSSIAYATAVSTWGTLTVNSGTLTLSAAAETFIGAVNIAGGTLSLGNTFTASSTTSVTGTISNLNSATVKTFTGLVTVNSGGSVNLTTATVPVVVIGAGVTTASGAGTVNFGTGATTFSASPTFTGPVNITIGAVTLASGLTLTNNMSATLTMASMLFGTAPASAITATLSNGSTTTVSGAITYAVGASAQNESILLNGTANLNAGSISMPAMTAAGSALITCVASCTGTLAVTGAVTITGNSTAAQAGVSTVAMDTGNMTVGGLLTIPGGSVTAATLSQSTGNLTLSAGITFSGTSANAKLTTTGANTITFTGTWTNTSPPTLTINAGTTLKTTGIATLCVTSGITWPGKLWVSAGTTSLALANTITGTTEVTGTLQNTSGATNKIFTGAVTLDSGSTFNMSVVTAATAEFRGGIIVNSGAVAFTSGSTTTFSVNSQSISGTGTIALTLGTTTINANIILTNNYTGGNVNIAALTVTGGAITANSGMSLSTGTATNITTTLTIGANASAGAFSDTITLNGTATLTVGTTATFTIPTTTVSGAKEGIIAASSASGTVTINGATTINGGATGTQFCGIDLSAGTNALTTAAVTLTGGATGAASIIMSTGALTINGAVTFGVAGNITRSVITTGASAITLNNSALGANGTLSIATATSFTTTGTTALNGAVYTFPMLTVSTGTTTLGGADTISNNLIVSTGAILKLGGFGFAVNGTSSISGSVICPALATCTGAKTFTGAITINSGGSFNLATGAPTPVASTSFGSDITMASGAIDFNTYTGATSFTSVSVLSGPVAMTFGGTVTIGTGTTASITNSNTSVGGVTFGALSIFNGAGGAEDLFLSDLSTTNVTGAISFVSNNRIFSQTITMNGNANLNAGSVSIPAGSNTGNSSVICSAGSGTFTVTGALSIAAGTTAGASTLAMDTCTLVANGLVTITGGTVGVASISASTGTLNFNASITFATTLAQARITTSGAANIYFTGTVTGVGILSGINSATTIHTQGTVSINSAIALPNLTVDTGTTTMNAGVGVSTGGLTVASGAVMQFTGNNFTSSGTTNVSGTIRCTAAATCTGTKTFTGAVTIQSGGVFDLTVGTPTVIPTLSFNSDITMASGATTFNTNTGTTTFTANSTLSGAVNMTLGAVVVNSGVLLTNSSTATVTGASFNINSGATGMSLSTGSTTTATSSIVMSSNATATNSLITMNGTANLNAVTFAITAPTSTGNVGVTCAGGSGTFTITGAATVTGNSTNTGTATLAMDTCTISVGGALTITGGTNATGIAGISSSTGTITMLGGFSGGSVNSRFTTTGAGIVNLTGPFVGFSGYSLGSATTWNTSGTTTLNTNLTYPNLNVLSGTTTVSATLSTFSGVINISGTLTDGTAGTNTTFSGPVTVNSGGNFNYTAFAMPTIFAAGITMNGTTFNTGTGTTTFSASQSLAGSSAMIFGGAVTISSGFTLTNSNTSTVDFNSSITGGSSTSNFATDLNSTTNFETTVMVTGKLTPGTVVNTIAYDGGTQTIKAPTTNPYYNLNITTAGVKSLSAITTATNTINISAGTLDTTAVSHYNINTGDIIIGNSGTLLGQAATITLTGNWSNSGTFTAGTSTVVMNGGTTVSVIGTTTFNNLTITHTSAKEVDFDSTGITHVTGIFNVTGHSGNLITLRSDATPTKWQIHPTGTASADYVDVMDGGCQSGSINISPTNLTNSGNNDSCWVPTFITFSNSDSSIGFGTLSSLNVCYATNDTLGSAGDVVAHSFNISTNATAGYALTYLGSTLTSGLNTITPRMNIGTGGTVGQSQFAISGTMTSSDTGAIISDYDHAFGQWSFVDSVTTTIANSSGPTTSDTIDMHYEANISPITPAGNYSTNITYIVTGNF